MPYRIPVIMLLCYYIIMLLPACSSYTCAHLLYLYASLILAHISLYLRSSLNISIAQLFSKIHRITKIVIVL